MTEIRVIPDTSKIRTPKPRRAPEKPFEEMTRGELREVARQRGIPLRLTKAEMIAALEAQGDGYRQAGSMTRAERDALRAVPVPVYHPAQHLEPKHAKSGMANNRYNRRNRIFEADTPSRNPFRPQVRIVKVRHKLPAFLEPFRKA